LSCHRIHIASAGTKCGNLRRPLRFDTGAVLAASEIKQPRPNKIRLAGAREFLIRLPRPEFG
jgi:hypothetical protein